MIPVTPLYREVLSASSRKFKAEILLNDEEIDGEILTLDIYKGSSPEVPTLGALYIPYFTAKIANLNTPLKGEDVTLKVGITRPETAVYLYATIGIFHVTEVKNDQTGSSIKAVGSAFYKLSNLTFTTSNGVYGPMPLSIQGMLDRISEIADVTIETDIPTVSHGVAPIRSNYIRNKPLQTGLGVIAGALGGFVTEDYHGNIVIKEFGSGSAIDVAADRSITPPTYDEYEYEITGIKCIVYDPDESTLYPEGLSYSAGRLVNYTYKNRFMDQTLFDSIAERFIGKHYYPGMVPMALGNPLIDPWDILNVEDIYSEHREVFPLQIHHHLDGGLSTDIDAEMPNKDGSQTGAISQSISNVTDQVITIDSSILAELDTKANDSDVVHIAGDETITGEKTFSAPINGTSSLTQAIPYGEVDSTSTATGFTATVEGITELKDGTMMLLKNGVKTSATNFTIDINNLGAKPVYSNLATGYGTTNPTRESSIFNIAYTMLFIYSEDLVEDGCWICYKGYYNSNTIGYQLRTNSTALQVTDTARYYKLYFTSADNAHWVPASINSTNDATTARAVNQRPINPLGRIVYTSASTKYTAGTTLAATTLWDQYTLSLGYSFNVNGGTLTLATSSPVFLKCAPQSDGSAIMDSSTPIVQSLPSTEDGKIYIYLGIAYSATQIELFVHHPIYYFKNGSIRLWSNCTSDEIVAMTGDEITNICQ